MKKAPYFMTFYNDLALLHSICNKQTLFFAAMASRMDADQVVQMTPYIREQIIDEIRVTSKNKLGAAKQYLHRLKKVGLVADIGKGAYMINPRIHGRNNMQNSIDKKTDIFMRVVYSPDGTRKKIECG